MAVVQGRSGGNLYTSDDDAESIISSVRVAERQARLIVDAVCTKASDDGTRKSPHIKKDFSELLIQARAYLSDLKFAIKRSEIEAVESVDRGDRRETLLHQLRQLAGEADKMTTLLNKAVIDHRAASERQYLRDREALLQSRFDGKDSAREATAIRNRMMGRQEQISIAKDVTAGLRRTRQMMTQELERVANVSLVLDEGSKTLEGTVQQYQGFSGAVQQAKNLLTTFHRRAKREKILVGLALAFFLSVVAYILYKRLKFFWKVLTFFIPTSLIQSALGAIGGTVSSVISSSNTSSFPPIIPASSLAQTALDQDISPPPMEVSIPSPEPPSPLSKKDVATQTESRRMQRISEPAPESRIANLQQPLLEGEKMTTEAKTPPEDATQDRSLTYSVPDAGSLKVNKEPLSHSVDEPEKEHQTSSENARMEKVYKQPLSGQVEAKRKHQPANDNVDSTRGLDEDASANDSEDGRFNQNPATSITSPAKEEL